MLKEPDMDESNHILLLKIGAEGGSLRLVLEMADLGVFSYRVIENSCEHLMFDDEDCSYPIQAKDEAYQCGESAMPLVIDWRGALKLLDDHKWPWPMFYPIFVHPCIREQLLTALKDRYSQYPHVSFPDWERDFSDS